MCDSFHDLCAEKRSFFLPFFLSFQIVTKGSSLRTTKSMSRPPLPQGAFHDQVIEWKGAFDLLDVSGEGFVNVEHVRTLVSTVAPAMQEKKLDEVLESLQLDSLTRLTFAQFYVVVTKVYTELGVVFTPEEMKSFALLHQAFTPFDKEYTGYVDADIFLALMMEKGAKLSGQEGVEMRSRLERMGLLKKGRVNYRAFLSYITSCVESTT